MKEPWHTARAGKVWLCSGDKHGIATITELAPDEGGHPSFFFSKGSFGANKWTMQRALPNRQGQKK